MFDDFDDIDDIEGLDYAGDSGGTGDFGLMSPRESDFCLGHDGVEGKLSSLIQSGDLAHGLIFHGPEGVGKATMAYRLIRTLFKSIGEGTVLDRGGLFSDDGDIQDVSNTGLSVARDDTVFRKVAACSYPDLMIVERQFDEQKSRLKTSLEVDHIRKVVPFLRMTSSEGGWRVVLIDDANTMNRSSQNALLKILEEPPRNTLLILVTHVLGHLIPTIRSRCQVVRFQALEDDVMLRLLQKMDPALTDSDLNILMRISEGSIGKGVQLYEGGGMDAMTAVLECLASYPDINWALIYDTVERFSYAGQEQAYLNFQFCTLWLLRRMVNAKARGLSHPDLPVDNAGVDGFYARGDLKGMLSLLDTCQEHFQSSDRSYIDKRQALLGAFFILNKFSNNN